MKTIIEISDTEHKLELFTIEQGNITEIKLDDILFSKNDGPDIQKSDEKPEVLFEKPEQKGLFSEQKSKNMKNLKSENWSKIEDQRLIDNQNLTVAEIIKQGLFPDRTNAAICCRINRLMQKGLFKKTYKFRKHRPGPTISKEKPEDPVKKSEIKSKKKRIKNLGGKKLASHGQNVYEDCFNDLIIKFENIKIFGTEDILEILVDSYKNIFDKDISKKAISTQQNYVYSYIRYGIENSFFERVGWGKYRIKKFQSEKPIIKEEKPLDEKIKNSDKPTITFVNPDSTPVKGFEDHKKKRYKEISDRKKNFPGLVKR